MTFIEFIGALLLGAGLAGFLLLARDVWRERKLPAHTHPEGYGTPDCPRCANTELDKVFGGEEGVSPIRFKE